MVSRQLLVVQDLHLQIRGEKIPQRRLDVWQEPGLDGAFFKGIAAMEHEGRVLHRYHRYLVEPGVDGGFGQLMAQPLEHAVPQVFHGIQAKAPLSAEAVCFPPQ